MKTFFQNILLVRKSSCRKPLIVVFIILFFFSTVQAQETLNSLSVEKKSYGLFLDANWNELVSFSKEAIDQGFDYFYLRYRLGYALYSLQHYRQAAMQFQHADKFNSSDSLNKVMLYYSYLNSERFSDAAFMKPAVTGKPNSQLVDFLYAEAGGKFSDIPDSIGVLSFFHIGLQSRFSRRITLYGGYSHATQDFFRDTISLNQLFIRGEFKLIPGISIAPAFSLLSVAITSPVIRNPPPMGMQPPPLAVITTTSTNYMAGANLLTSFGIFNVNAGGYFLQLDTRNSFQFPVSVSMYPFGNDRLVCFAEMNVLHNSGKTNQFFKEGLRVRIVKNFWVSADYLQSNLANFFESEGYSIDNSLNILKSRWQVMGIVHANKVNIFLTYQNETRTTSNFNLAYSLNNFFLGLKYDF